MIASRNYLDQHRAGLAGRSPLASRTHRRVFRVIKGLAVENLPEFTFGDVVARANTKNRKLVSSLLRKLTSMNVIERGLDAVFRQPVK